MTVNGITSAVDAYSGYTNTFRADQQVDKTTRVDLGKPEPDRTEEQKPKLLGSEEAAVFERSAATENDKTSTAKADKTVDNDALVAKLKADSEARIVKLQNIVKDLIAKQANAYGLTNNIYQALASGSFTIDEATKAEAQADIAEDGYFGVTQTSDRILDFAKALCNGDKSKAEELLTAFKKGYAQAEETWGGKLPDICKDTYDAVLEKFDAWMNEEA